MNWLTAAIASAGAMLAVFGAWRTADFFASIAADGTDRALAYGAAAALTVCQCVFYAAAQHMQGWQKLKFLSTSFLLLSVSVIATAGWAESRYQANHATTLNSDTLYLLKLQRAKNLSKDASTITQAAASDRKANYRTKAAEKIEQGTLLDDKLSAQIKELEQYKPSSTGNNSETIATAISQVRWGIWLLIAVLIDICQMLCAAYVSRNVTPEKKRSETPPKNHEEPAPKLTATEETHSDLTDQIAHEINAGTWGDTPAIRRVMDAHKIRHPIAIVVFDNLQQRGIIRREGNRFHRTLETPA